MPTILRKDGYRCYFYSHEPNEPPHVHVDKGNATLKAWLRPVSLARASGFRPREINVILSLVAEHEAMLLESWNEYFG
ncbi:MAG: DUF4160 domain-containing protein [Pseudomonadota bacterium]|uniref:DUF4160 domain-containing protein n=1 Tax=Sphingobium yanoikuyae TaxID=13690 RepID=A0A430BYQ9_SPHYA|nr:DUF4160 domain-containing protein [Sphingobium yanoikuyae]NBB41245.1 DUF4160 domain-containing protein [Sphingobium yanoikuyae]RSU57892.1 DUF4160 domain-containing protein [Sphingobium yanoikuyae]